MKCWTEDDEKFKMIMEEMGFKGIEAMYRKESNSKMVKIVQKIQKFNDVRETYQDIYESFSNVSAIDIMDKTIELLELFEQEIENSIPYSKEELRNGIKIENAKRKKAKEKEEKMQINKREKRLARIVPKLGIEKEFQTIQKDRTLTEEEKQVKYSDLTLKIYMEIERSENILRTDLLERF